MKSYGNIRISQLLTIRCQLAPFPNCVHYFPRNPQYLWSPTIILKRKHNNANITFSDTRSAKIEENALGQQRDSRRHQLNFYSNRGNQTKPNQRPICFSLLFLKAWEGETGSETWYGRSGNLIRNGYFVHKIILQVGLKITW